MSWFSLEKNSCYSDGALSPSGKKLKGRMSQFFLDLKEVLSTGRRTGKRKQTEILERESSEPLSWADPRPSPVEQWEPLIWLREGVALNGWHLRQGTAQMSVLAEISGFSGSLSHFRQTLFGRLETVQRCRPEAKPALPPSLETLGVRISWWRPLTWAATTPRKFPTTFTHLLWVWC